MDLFEDLIKGIDGQTTHFDEFHYNFFCHLDGKFLFLLHDISPKEPPLSGRRQFLYAQRGPMI